MDTYLCTCGLSHRHRERLRDPVAGSTVRALGNHVGQWQIDGPSADSSSIEDDAIIVDMVRRQPSMTVSGGRRRSVGNGNELHHRPADRPRREVRPL